MKKKRESESESESERERARERETQSESERETKRERERERERERDREREREQVGERETGSNTLGEQCFAGARWAKHENALPWPADTLEVVGHVEWEDDGLFEEPLSLVQPSDAFKRHTGVAKHNIAFQVIDQTLVVDAPRHVGPFSISAHRTGWPFIMWVVTLHTAAPRFV